MTEKFTTTLKFLRKKFKLKQSDLKFGAESSNSSFSRLESGKLQLKLQHIEQICEQLNITLNEFLYFAKADDESNDFFNKLRQASNTPNDVLLKSDLLNQYNDYQKRGLKHLTLKELAFFFAIKNNLHKFWYDIQKINEKDVSFITKILTDKDFYVMYDYCLALNTINYMDSKQADKIIKQMGHLTFVDQRSPQTKKYANILLTNAITLKNYNQEYEKALQYIEIAEEQDPEFQSYYFRFDIQYHKNIALYFLQKDTKYIDEARRLIETIEAIQDIKTAKVYTQELNNLISNPAYYKNNNDYDVIFIKEQN